MRNTSEEGPSRSPRSGPWRDSVRLELGGISLTSLDGGVLGFRAQIRGREMLIELAVRPVLVQGKDFSILVDTGFGPADPVRRRKFHCVDPVPIEEQLALMGLPDGPDLVFLTHLHFDHAGGVLLAADDGTERARFARSRVLVQHDEWDAAMADSRGGALASRIECSFSREIERIEGNEELVKGVRLETVPGHTEGLVVVWIEGEEDCCLLPSDLVPTRRFLHARLDPVADKNPELALEARMRVLEQAHLRRSLIFFYHDPAVAYGRIEKQGTERYGIDIRPEGRR